AAGNAARSPPATSVGSVVPPVQAEDGWVPGLYCRSRRCAVACTVASGLARPPVPPESAPASSLPRMLRQNSSWALGSVGFLRNREKTPLPDVVLELIAPTELSTICHNRFVGLPTKNNNTVISPATTILVNIDNASPASKMACSSNTCTPASTDSTNRLNATPPSTRATRRNRS